MNAVIFVEPPSLVECRHFFVHNSICIITLSQPEFPIVYYGPSPLQIISGILSTQYGF